MSKTIKVGILVCLVCACTPKAGVETSFQSDGSNSGLMKTAEEMTLLLTGGGIKYWDCLGNAGEVPINGMCFDTSKVVRNYYYDYQLYKRGGRDSCRYWLNGCSEIVCRLRFRLRGDSIVVTYGEPCDTNYIVDSYVIMSIADEKMVLREGEKTITYQKSMNQNNGLETHPMSIAGFELPQLVSTPNEIASIIEGASKACEEKGVGHPDSFKIKVNCKIDDSGHVYENGYYDETGEDTLQPASQSGDEYFFDLLLRGLKELKFVPAKNDRIHETYFYEMIVPIIYSPEENED